MGRELVAFKSIQLSSKPCFLYHSIYLFTHIQQVQFLKSGCTLESLEELLKLCTPGVAAVENPLSLSHNLEQASVCVSVFPEDAMC